MSGSKDYTRKFATAFCQFKLPINMRLIRYENEDTQFQNPFATESYIRLAKGDLKNIVREEIEKNDDRYMISRFFLLRVLDPRSSKKLFDNEKWFKRCLKIEKKAFLSVFNIKGVDEQIVIRQIELNWMYDSLSDYEEKKLEEAMLEFARKVK